MTEGPDNVVRISSDTPATPEEPPSTPPTRLHGLAIGGMALSALLGIVSMLAFITVNWPGDTSRYIVGAFVFAADAGYRSTVQRFKCSRSEVGA